MPFSLRSNGDTSILVNLQPYNKGSLKFMYGDDGENGPHGTIGVRAPREHGFYLIPLGTLITDILNGDTLANFVDTAEFDAWAKKFYFNSKGCSWAEEAF